MNEYLQIQRKNYIKKLVSNAKAIISNQVGLPFGIYKMHKILLWINNIEPVTTVDFATFNDYYLLTNKYCIGTEMLFCNRDFLKEQDKKLDKITSTFKNKIIDKCFEIIEILEQ